MSYQERQQKWMDTNNIKVGDEVRILRKATSYEDGWGTTWESSMNVCDGKLGVISGVDRNLGIHVEFVPGTTWYFPYFVLEKVTKEDTCPIIEDSWLKQMVHTHGMSILHAIPSILIGAGFTLLAWNISMPHLFNLPTMNIVSALGLYILCRNLFGIDRTKE
jgi:hypothetical protein